MAEISQSVFAKIAGVKRQAVYMAVKRGIVIINSAKLIDTENKQNLIWLRSHGKSEKDVNQYLAILQEKEKQKRKIKSRSNPIPKIREKIKKKQIQVEQERIEKIQKYIEPKPEIITKNPEEKKETDEIDFENITGLPARMMKLNLKQLVMRYGGPMMLDSWSKILQRLMSANEKDQKIQERRLELIEKDFVISRLFSYLETLSNRLFDYTENIPIGIIALVNSGIENMEFRIKEKMRKDFSNLIRDAKENVNRELQNLKKKYEKGKDDNTNSES